MTVLEAREHVFDRIVMAQRLGGAYHAEGDGMMLALYSEWPDEQYAETDLRVRFLVGFRDARNILAVAARQAQETMVPA